MKTPRLVSTVLLAHPGRAARLAAGLALSSGGVGWAQTITEWTGATDTNWFDAGNWDNGVPSTASAVIGGITSPTPANSPLINGGNASTSDLLLGAVSGGNGTLTLQGGATLVSTGSAFGVMLGSASGGTGNVLVTGAGSSWTMQGDEFALEIGSLGTGTLTIADGGAVTSWRAFVGREVGSTGSVTVTGTGSTWTSTSDLEIGAAGSGTMELDDGARADTRFVYIGFNSGGTGVARVSGSSTHWSADGSFHVGYSGAGSVTLDSGGTLSTTGTTHIARFAASTGTLNVGAAAGDDAAAPGTLTTPLVQFGAGTGKLVFNHTDANYTFASTIAGAGAVEVRAGTTTLSGTHTYTGVTSVVGGQLIVTGSAASSAFTVNGGILSGTGTVGALTVASGGTLSPGASPGTLSAGDTIFAGGGNMIWEINNAAGSAGANSGWDLLSISGALNITANASSRFTIHLTSLTLLDATGEAGNFDPGQDYSFVFATTGGITSFDADAFTLDPSGFQNVFAGSWSIAQSGNDLLLNYSASAIPEPSTYAAFGGAAALGLAAWRRRTRRAS